MASRTKVNTSSTVYVVRLLKEDAIASCCSSLDHRGSGNLPSGLRQQDEYRSNVMMCLPCVLLHPSGSLSESIETATSYSAFEMCALEPGVWMMLLSEACKAHQSIVQSKAILVGRGLSTLMSDAFRRTGVSTYGDAQWKNDAPGSVK